jgi:hypothetical protein
MISRDEILLMTAIIGLYLYDSAMLLYGNQAILAATRRGKWLVEFGSSTYQVLRKDLYIPNPFLPHRAQFLLSWKLEGGPAEAEVSLAEYARSARPLGLMVWCMAMALFVLLPLGFFTRLGDPMLLIAVLVLYASIIAALAWLWMHRGSFRLTGKKFAAIAFESVVCSPFALNLVRKVTLGVPVHEDLVSAAMRLQDAEGWDTTRATLVRRLNEKIEAEEENTDRMAALLEQRRRLTGDACPAPKSS